MDDDYYQFTIEHSLLTDEIRHADSAALVALKTRAYLNLIQDKQNEQLGRTLQSFGKIIGPNS